MKTWGMFVATLSAAVCSMAADVKVHPEGCTGVCNLLTHKAEGRYCVKESTGERCVFQRCAQAGEKVCDASDEMHLFDLLGVVKDAVTTDTIESRGRMGAPSSSTTSSWLTEGALAWTHNGPRAPRGEYVDVHPEVVGLAMESPSYAVREGFKFKFDCPDAITDAIAQGKAVAGCDAWVFYYSCPWSCEAKWQSPVLNVLRRDGWQLSQCAPYFTNGVTEFRHRMRSYRKQLLPGESYQFETEGGVAEFVSFGTRLTDVVCSEVEGQPACEGHASCRWMDTTGECMPYDCHTRGKGPPSPCRQCPWQGLDEAVSRRQDAGPW